MHGTKEGLSKKSSGLWSDLNNGDCSIPPTGLEFYNTRLLHNPVSQHSTIVAPMQEPTSRHRQKEKCGNNNPGDYIGGLLQQTNSLAVGAQGKAVSKPHKRHSYNDSLHYTGHAPPYNQLATSNYRDNSSSSSSRYSYYPQHYHT